MDTTQIKFGLPGFSKPSHVGAALAVLALLAATAVIPCRAGAQSQTTFTSPEDASHALVAAVSAQDEHALTQILGGGKALISAEDATEDALERQYFLQKYREMHRWSRGHAGPTMLYVGAENWPFPIPLVLDNGVWRFDSSAGSQEILFRRIGENEVAAIGACSSLLAGTAPSARDRQVGAPAMTREPILFHGYYFHTLSTSDGGLAAIAYPALYRVSGVMTFIVTQAGGLSERDLGPRTVKVAGAMSTYESDPSWTPVDRGESVPAR